MPTKTASQTAKPNRRKAESPQHKLFKLIEKQQVLSKQLLELMEELEDAEDARLLDAAIKENAGKPGIPWEEAKKKLGLKFD
jgi:hypothetical protein